MPTWFNRTCKCGRVDFTASSSPVCKVCAIEAARQERIQEERKKVLSIYGNVNGPTEGDFGKRCYTFVHSCGTKQTWRYDNILKQLKTQPEPCQSCGGKARTKNATAAYVEIYGRDYDLKKFTDYATKVRRMSDKIYKQNVDVINPRGLKRGWRTYHLDHIVPIVECFKRGWSPEKAAALENLQMLTAGDNLSKGKR